ncbi:hypothetical protein MycrhDRAFT_5710 [Mycolicibacterium rhodesiae JS60]|nr:hypothetical protein MycrhDRAFT_5710 [Mycolicibacterium rhodesiae JS60]
MCKASHEPGGPQRCSGDARRNYQQSADSVMALEQRLAEVTAEINVARGEVLDELLVARSEIRKAAGTDGPKGLPAAELAAFAADCAHSVREIDRLLATPQDQWTDDDYESAGYGLDAVLTQVRDFTGAR